MKDVAALASLGSEEVRESAMAGKSLDVLADSFRVLTLWPDDAHTRSGLVSRIGSYLTCLMACC
jgi:hypothetical protein